MEDGINDTESSQYKIVVINAVGMMCASQLGQMGHSILLIDHSARFGEKIRISGGGRCIFTNLNQTNVGESSKFFSASRRNFVYDALKQYTPDHFIEFLTKAGIKFHEKHKGQLFCDQSSLQVIDLLENECHFGKVEYALHSNVIKIQYDVLTKLYRLEVSSSGESTFIEATALVIDTGGLSKHLIGATGWGFAVAQQFGHSIIETFPGLVALTFAEWSVEGWSCLTAIALSVNISIPTTKKTLNRAHTQFSEDTLFYHRGLKEPAYCRFQIIGMLVNLLSLIYCQRLICQKFSVVKNHGLN